MKWYKAMALAVVVGLLACAMVYGVSLKTYKDKVAGISLQQMDMDKFEGVADGEYIGESDAGFVRAKVKVTVVNGRIEGIDLLEHKQERGKAAESVVEDILQSRRFPVDAVSGATSSSKVIQDAVQDAVDK